MTRFKTVLYRRPGAAHRREGKQCEDNVHNWSDLREGATCVALSDGAGSCRNAAVGSETVVKVSSELLARRFSQIYDMEEDEVKRYVISETIAPLQERAELDGQDLESYSATLLLAAMHSDGRYLVFHVGDGVVVGYTDEGENVVLSRYEHDGPVNQTVFVTTPDVPCVLKRGAGGFLSFALMSDGPEDFLVHEAYGGSAESNVRQEVNPRVRLMQQLSFAFSEKEMQEQIDSLTNLLEKKGMFDDVSFAVISDGRAFPEVMKQMNSALREVVVRNCIKKNRQKILNIFFRRPNGITRRKITNILFKRPKMITRRALKRELRAYMKFVAKNGCNLCGTKDS